MTTWADLPESIRQDIRQAAAEQLSSRLSRINERIVGAVDERDYNHLKRQRERVIAALEAAKRLP